MLIFQSFIILALSLGIQQLPLTNVILPTYAKEMRPGSIYTKLQHSNPSRSDITMNKTPHTVLEMIENIKVGLYNKVFFSDYFYDENTLRNFFGAKSIRWRSSDKPGEKKWADIYDFEKISKPVEINGHLTDGILILIRHTIIDKKTTFGLHLSSLRGAHEIYFEDITRLFGEKWSSYPYFPIPHGMIFKPPTNLHGNQRIKYEFQGSPSGHVVFEFSENGNLKRMDLYLEKL